MDKEKFEQAKEKIRKVLSKQGSYPCSKECGKVSDIDKAILARFDDLIIDAARGLVAVADEREEKPVKSEMPRNCKQETFLKPCPFCGNKEVDICSVDMDGNPMKPRIYCSTCETIWQAMRDVSPEYFAQQWNTRNVAVAQMDAEVAKCDCIKEKPKTLEDILEEAKAELTDSKTFVTIMLRRVDD